jgi:hypothetical protein
MAVGSVSSNSGSATTCERRLLTLNWSNTVSTSRKILWIVAAIVIGGAVWMNLVKLVDQYAPK